MCIRQKYEGIKCFCYRAGGIPARNNRGDRLFLYIGIIDILQNYRMAKKLEHTFKSMLHEGVRTLLYSHLYFRVVVNVQC